jgi:hypothetical protein
MMRQGTPANDVLVFLPNSDAWASGASSMNAALGPKVGGGGGRGGRGGQGGGANTGNITGSLLAAGYNLDYVDDQLLAMKGKVEGNTIAFGDVKYRAIVLPPTQRIMPGTMKMLEDFAKGGGIVIAVGNAPQQAPGYLATDADQQTVKEAAQRLFQGGQAMGALVQNAGELGATLTAKGLKPDFALAPANPGVGFVHRHTADADVYFVANTNNEPVSGKTTFRVDGMQAEIWDPMTGQISGSGAQGSTIELNLPAYGSTIVVFTKRAPALAAKPATPNNAAPIDLSKGWTVRFGKEGEPVQMDSLQDWAKNEKTKAFSGVATYEKSFNAPADMIKPGSRIVLDLGESRPPEGGGGRGGQGYHANLEAPVKEVAVVYLNDKRIGSVWAPPYTLDVTDALKAGENKLRIEVANTAINYMAQNPYPNYNLQGVRQTYGNRFDPQGLNLVEFLPSGLTGPITIKPAAAQ